MPPQILRQKAKDANVSDIDSEEASDTEEPKMAVIHLLLRAADTQQLVNKHAITNDTHAKDNQCHAKKNLVNINEVTSTNNEEKESALLQGLSNKDLRKRAQDARVKEENIPKASES